VHLVFSYNLSAVDAYQPPTNKLHYVLEE